MFVALSSRNKFIFPYMTLTHFYRFQFISISDWNLYFVSRIVYHSSFYYSNTLSSTKSVQSTLHACFIFLNDIFKGPVSLKKEKKFLSGVGDKALTMHHVGLLPYLTRTLDRSLRKTLMCHRNHRLLYSVIFSMIYYPMD